MKLMAALILGTVFVKLHFVLMVIHLLGLLISEASRKYNAYRNFIYSTRQGNGFPLCPTNVDVSGFDHWVTLAELPADQRRTQIKTSLIRCMNLYWNTELVKTSVDAEASDSGSVAQLNTQDFEHKIMKTATVALEPRERVCYGKLTGLRLSQSAASTIGTETCTAIVSFELNPIRMYNGATTDINNFVGFGSAT